MHNGKTKAHFRVSSRPSIQGKGIAARALMAAVIDDCGLPGHQQVAREGLAPGQVEGAHLSAGGRCFRGQQMRPGLARRLIELPVQGLRGIADSLLSDASPDACRHAVPVRLLPTRINLWLAQDSLAGYTLHM